MNKLRILTFVFLLIVTSIYSQDAYTKPKDLHVNIITEAFKYDEIITVNTTWYVEINEILIRVFQDSEEELDQDELETIAINTVKLWILDKKHNYTDYKRVSRKMMFDFEYENNYYNIMELRYVLSNKKNIKLPKKTKTEDKK